MMMEVPQEVSPKPSAALSSSIILRRLDSDLSRLHLSLERQPTAMMHNNSLITAIWLLAVASSCVHGALNFKIFNDPKSVVTKSDCSSNAVACDPIDIDAIAADGGLKAQDKEDYCLLKHYFPGVCQGRYLEIGAGDGIEYSNSFLLYNSDLGLGWKGVNVELNPDSY